MFAVRPTIDGTPVFEMSRIASENFWAPAPGDTSAMGQLRQIDTTPAVATCPLRPQSLPSLCWAAN
jgi:hypothetical protein